MGELDNYVQIMINSLEKKAVILDRLISKTKEQAEILKSAEFDNVDWDQFNMVMTEKEEEIEHINEMDQGFQALYDRVGEQLKTDKSQYTDAIKRMQELIKLLEEKSIQIRAGEERNRTMISSILGGRKKEIKQTRNSMKVASSYYQTMSKTLGADYSSVDKKK